MSFQYWLMICEKRYTEAQVYWYSFNQQIRKKMDLRPLNWHGKRIKRNVNRTLKQLRVGI